MKKALSIVLLISMLMSMVIVPSSAAEEEEYLTLERTNLAAGISAFWRWSAPFPAGNTAAGKAKRNAFTQTIFNGEKSHSYCDSNAAISAHPQVFLTPTYDINGLQSGKNVDEIEYYGILAWPLAQPGVTDTIRVYFDDIAADGTPCRWLPDNCDIIISPDGTAGSWKVVYSETNIRCESKYKVYEDKNGNKTAYIEATFPATEISHFGIAFKEQPRCFHLGDNDSIIGHKNENIQRAQVRITEIEVLAPGGKLVPINGAEWGPEENVSTGKASVTNSKNIVFANDRLFPYLFDGTVDNAWKEGSTSLHYCDPRLENSAILSNGQRYDLAGDLAAADATHKYLCYFDIDLKKLQYVDNIKVYLDALNVAGNAHDELLINGFDLLVSEDGTNWKTVYSEVDIKTKEKYELRENIGLNDSGSKAQQAWINVEFDITAARYVRFGLTEARIPATKYWRLVEIEVFGHDLILPAPPVEETEGEGSGINSLMLFPLLMRHRQYETENSTTMFGLRVKHLLRSADAITFEKNGVKIDIPAAAFEALNLAGSDKLVVTIIGEQVTVTVNGEAVDIEGIASSTPEEPEEKGTTYRWDFDNLNEKNGLNNLTDSAKSTKNYTIEDGILILADSETDFEMAETIDLNNWTDWSIEWRAKLDQRSCLFGTAASNQNFIYLAYSVSAFKFPLRMVDANNKILTIKYGDYASLNEEMNTWKAEYSAEENRLTLKFFDEASQSWEVVGAGTPPAFNFELTHMFGRYGDASVSCCLKGQVDYIEVYIGE